MDGEALFSGQTERRNVDALRLELLCATIERLFLKLQRYEAARGSFIVTSKKSFLSIVLTDFTLDRNRRLRKIAKRLFG